MTHDDAFMQAIREQPDDDAPRLLYADWLEEQGDQRGEFIRVQCRLAKLPYAVTGRRNKPTGVRPHPAVEPLWSREQVLLTPENAVAWSPSSFRSPNRREPGRSGRSLIYAGSSDSAHVLGSLAYAGPSDRRPNSDGSRRGVGVAFRRGFVEEIACPADWWFHHEAAILREALIRLVRLTTWPLLGVGRPGPGDVRPFRLYGVNGVETLMSPPYASFSPGHLANLYYLALVARWPTVKQFVLPPTWPPAPQALPHGLTPKSIFLP